MCRNAISQLALRRQGFAQGAVVIRSESVQAIVLVAHYLRVLRAQQNPTFRLDRTETELKVRSSPAIWAIDRSISRGAVSHVRRSVNSGRARSLATASFDANVTELHIAPLAFVLRGLRDDLTS